MKPLFIATVFILFSTAGKADLRECHVPGQFTVVSSFNKQAFLQKCVRDEDLKLLRAQNIETDELLRLTDGLTEADIMTTYFTDLNLGNSLKESRTKIKSTGKVVRLKAPLHNRYILEAIGHRLNDLNGSNERIVRKIKQDKLKAKRKLVKTQSVPMSLSILASTVKNNKALAEKLTPSNCQANDNNPQGELKIYKVWFKDGAETLLLAYDGRQIDANTFEFSSPRSSKRITGLSLEKIFTGPRRIIFRGDEILWESGGERAPVAGFAEISADEALGVNFFPGISGKSKNACFYADLIRPPNSFMNKHRMVGTH